MKNTCLMLAVSGLLIWSCNNTGNQPDTTLAGDSSSANTLPVDAATVSRKTPAYPESCNFQAYIDRPTTTRLTRQIFGREDWDGNDIQALHFIDSLTTRDTAARAFYFRLVTNIPSNRGLDYREAFYMDATEYLTGHPAAFLAFFDRNACFSDADMRIWADMVAAEYGIQDENDVKPALARLFKDLRQKCSRCTDEQKANLERFITMVNESV
jgi:hypothetical protein